MKRILFLTTIIAFGFASCTDLDDVLYDRVTPEDYTADPVLKMTPIYQPLRLIIDDEGCWWFGQELTGDGACAPTRGEHWGDGGKWRVLHTHTWNNNVETIVKMWGVFYEGAAEANKFIDEYLPMEGDEVIDLALAKARIMRSYYYYLLMDNYGDIPYETSYVDSDPTPSKVDRAYVFEQIVNEVEENIKLLDRGTSRTAVTKGMAYSLLAKLYLNHAVYTGNEDAAMWAKAEAVCDSIIELGVYSLESNALGPFITENQNSPENIFVIPFDEDTYHGFRLHMRTLHYNSNQTFDMQAGPWNGFAALESQYNLYEDNDRRKDGFLAGQQYDSKGDLITDAGAEGAPLVLTPSIPYLHMTADNSTVAEMRMSGTRVVKFEVKKGAKDNLSNNFPLFRYGDVLLMKAEALVRQGKNGDEYVNMIRERANVDPWSNATLEMILEERARELFWEGHRRQDLIRFGKFNDTWWEKPESTPDRNTFPVPQWAIDANPNLAD